MQEIGLKYKGKRCPFTLKNPRLTEDLNFVSKDTVVWVKKAEYDWLIANNPRMFDVVSKRGSEKKPTAPAIERIGEVEPTPETEPVIPEIKIEVVDKPEVVEQKETLTSNFTPPVEEKPKKRGMPKGGWPKNK